MIQLGSTKTSDLCPNLTAMAIIAKLSTGKPWQSSVHMSHPYHHIGFPFRVEKGTVRVEGAFSVRFYDAGTLRPTPVPRANEYLHQTWMPRLLRSHSDLMEKFASSSILEAISGGTESSTVTPWFTEYSQEVSQHHTAQMIA